MGYRVAVPQPNCSLLPTPAQSITAAQGRHSSGRLSMRVFERGVGETMSCGTGVVASVAAYRRRSGFDGPVEVAVPGGELSVTFDGDQARLTGPAVIVGRGEFWI